MALIRLFCRLLWALCWESRKVGKTAVDAWIGVDVWTGVDAVLDCRCGVPKMGSETDARNQARASHLAAQSTSAIVKGQTELTYEDAAFELPPVLEVVGPCKGWTYRWIYMGVCILAPSLPCFA